MLEAIRLYTTDSAYTGSEEASKGSLEPDKLANLIVLSEGPFEVPVDALRDLQVEITLVGGRVIHEGRG